MMFQSGSYLQSLGKSIRHIGDRAMMKKQSSMDIPIKEISESSDSSSDDDNNLEISRASSSPHFFTFISLITQGASSSYARQKSIHEEYRNYISTPTFAYKQTVIDLDQAKNKSIEQPSQPMLHPVLLEPKIFKKDEFCKIKKSEIESDVEKNKKELSCFECPICLNRVKNGDLIVQAKCGHIFHHKCVQPWFVEHHSCPICRAEIESA